MPTVQDFQVMQQRFAHLAGFEETIQVRLMQVGQQVLHVQRLDVLPRQQWQVVDNQFLLETEKCDSPITMPSV